MTTKAKKLISGSLSNGAVFIFRIGVSLFMTPLMISCFGETTYGLWILIGSFSGFYVIMDLGLLSAVKRYMSRAVGNNDKEEANYVFNTSLFVFSFLGLFAFLLTCLFVYFAPFLIKNVQNQNIDILRSVIVLLSINIIIGFPMRSFWGILSSNLRYDISAYLDLLNVIIKTTLFVIFLKLGYGILFIAFLSFISDLLWNILNVIYSFRVAPYLKISKQYIDIRKIKTFLDYSIFAFIAKIAGTMKFNLDNFVISSFLGLSFVSVYSIGIRLIQYASQLLIKLIGMMGPVFSQYEGRGDYESIKKYFFFVLKIAVYLSFLFGAMLIIFGKPFILRWLGKSFNNSYGIILILVCPIVMRMLMDPVQGLLYGISKHKMLTVVNLCEAVINLTLSIIFVHYWGMRGVALGTAIPLFIVKFFFEPIYVSKVLKVKVADFYSKLLYNMLLAGSVLIILSKFIIPFISATFTSIIFLGIVLSGVYLLIVSFLGFTKDERFLVLSALKLKK